MRPFSKETCLLMPKSVVVAMKRLITNMSQVSMVWDCTPAGGVRAISRVVTRVSVVSAMKRAVLSRKLQYNVLVF
jgi:hypothetical protein